MKSPFARIIVAIASTTLLHASIFYTLKDTKKPDIIRFKTIEIALVDTYTPQKKVSSVKVEENPEPVVREARKPKETLKPKPSPEPKKRAEKIIKKEALTLTSERVIEKDLIIKESAETTQEEPIHTAVKDTIVTSIKPINKELAINSNELHQYLYEVREKIQRGLNYPSIARKLRIEGESIINFEILNHGKVNSSSIKLMRSSGHKALDDEALEVISKVLPFKPPPKNKISVTVPIIFNLR